MRASTRGGAADRDGRVLYRGTRVDKRMYVGYMWFVAALIAPFIFAPAKGGLALRIFAGCMVAAFMFLAIRGRNMGTIRADSQTITACGAIRHWRWTWDDIDHLAAETRGTPFAPSAHPCLTVYLATGQRVQIRSVNASPSSKCHDWLDRAVTALNSQNRRAQNSP